MCPSPRIPILLSQRQWANEALPRNYAALSHQNTWLMELTTTLAKALDRQHSEDMSQGPSSGILNLVNDLQKYHQEKQQLMDTIHCQQEVLEHQTCQISALSQRLAMSGQEAISMYKEDEPQKAQTPPPRCTYGSRTSWSISS